MNFDPTLKAAQTALAAKGFVPCAADGLPGPETRARTREFQKANGLTVDGVIGQKTLQALGVIANGADKRPLPPWLTLAQQKMGLNEIRNNAELRAFLKSDGHTLGDPAKLPWCGDFVETCVYRACPEEPTILNPYLARNWMKFGEASDPVLGAVMVFWRGSKSGTDGHVAFYWAETADAYCVIGGNQSNAIGYSWLAKDRLLGARVPRTYPMIGYGRSIVTKRDDALSVNEA